MSKTLGTKNNRTIEISKQEIDFYSKSFLSVNSNISKESLIDQIINQDVYSTLKFFPDSFVDLLFLDPPYNMSKSFNGNKFVKKSISEYTSWLDLFVQSLVRLLKPNASVYVCGDWFSSTSIHTVLEKYFKVRNRITWEREKGRGSKTNWKNSSEDIWFATVSNNFTFNIEDIKLKKKIIAPYKENGVPKGWEEQNEGAFRLTHPSNLWTDITVPFWSMPENTEHPTQKPEKLLAKIILASSDKGNIVFDPFLGSGTTAVTAKKLDRKFLGIELDEKFAAIAKKRIEMVNDNKNIQGYKDGIFWERNSLSLQQKGKKKIK